MRVAYVAHTYLPNRKAHGVHITAMCDELAQLGNEVCLFIPYKKDISAAEIRWQYAVSAAFNIQQITVPNLKRSTPLRFYFVNFLFVASALWHVLWWKPDVIHSRDPLSVLILSLFHSSVFLELHDENDSAVVRWAIYRARHVIVTNSYLKQLHAAQANADKRHFSVIQNGVDIERFDHARERVAVRSELQLPRNDFIVGYIGKMKTMGNEKGVRKIAQAFIDLKQSVQDAHLLVVGLSENEKEELEEELRPSGIPDSAYTLTTYVPSQNVPQYMCACNALIINYPPEPHFQYYMSPLKLFEYMASGVPIIATDLPAIREVVNEEHAWFVADYEPQNLSETIKAVHDNRTEAERRANNAKERVESFTWQQRALSLITLMKGYSRK